MSGGATVRNNLDAEFTDLEVWTGDVLRHETLAPLPQTPWSSLAIAATPRSRWNLGVALPLRMGRPKLC